MDDGPEDDEENSPPNPDSCAVSPHNFGSLHESGRFEVLDRALDSLENGLGFRQWCRPLNALIHNEWQHFGGRHAWPVRHFSSRQAAF